MTGTFFLSANICLYEVYSLSIVVYIRDVPIVQKTISADSDSFCHVADISADIFGRRYIGIADISAPKILIEYTC